MSGDLRRSPKEMFCVYSLLSNKNLVDHPSALESAMKLAPALFCNTASTPNLASNPFVLHFHPWCSNLFQFRKLQRKQASIYHQNALTPKERTFLNQLASKTSTRPHKPSRSPCSPSPPPSTAQREPRLAGRDWVYWLEPSVSFVVYQCMATKYPSSIST